MNLKSIKIGFTALALVLTTYSVQAQKQEHNNPNVRLGQKALMDGNFKSAITYLEKAMPAEEKDAHVVYLLGQAQFLSGSYQNAVTNFSKVIALDPSNTNAYFSRAKSNNILAITPNESMTDARREQLLKYSILDYSKAISIDSKDIKYYQNRGLAYRDLGINYSAEGSSIYNKSAAIEAYNKAIVDFEKVLTFDSSRKDIQTELKKAKVYRDLLK